MAEFVRVETKNGGVQYRNKTENKVVAKDSLPEAVREELDLADAGTVIDSETVTQGAGDGVVPATDRNTDNKEQTGNQESDQDNKDPVETNPYKRETPQSEKGFGFPRKGGKTVDIFDGKTPHTHLRLIEGYHLPVPLSEKSQNTKSDAEIYDRLVELELIER